MIFNIFLRGREVVIDGWVEPADRSVGIMGESFCPESIKDVETGNEVEFDSLSDSELLSIDEAFWDSQPFEPAEHAVYEYGLGEGLGN